MYTVIINSLLSAQDLLAVARVLVASGRGPWRRPPLQRDPDRPLLGPHLRVLHQQVTTAATAALPVTTRPVSSPPPLTPRLGGGDPSKIAARVGASERTLTPEAAVVHRKWKGQSGGHDLALLKLPGPKGHCLTFDPRTNAACLPPAGTPPEAGGPSSCVVMVTTGPGTFPANRPTSRISATSKQIDPLMSSLPQMLSWRPGSP